MSTTTKGVPAPVEAIRRQGETAAWLISGAAILGFAALTAAAGQVRVPLYFTPVPLTLQPLPALLAGAMLGSRRGMASQALFILGGGLGLPIFAGGGAGAGHLLGPTGGYLIGFMAAAWVTGRLLRALDTRAFLPVIGVMFTGMLIVHAFGVAHLSVFLGTDIGRAAWLGTAPFLVPDLLKAVLATSIIAGATALGKPRGRHDDARH
jgi:biotin transport system substrate-specific component